MTVILPPEILRGTYAERIAYNTTLLIPGQVWDQTDTVQDGSTIYKAGYYYWIGGSQWQYDETQGAGGIDLDGRGQNLGMGGAFRVNNGDTENESTWITANPTDYRGFTGLWERSVNGPGYVIGLYVEQAFDTFINVLKGRTLGLWSFNSATGSHNRIADFTHNLNSDGRMRQTFHYGDDAGSGEVRIVMGNGVNTGSFGNVSTSETDVFTFTVPANSLVTDGHGLKFFVAGTTAANANSKRARLMWGATAIADTTSIAANGVHWEIEARVIRTGAATQLVVGRACFGTNAFRFTNTTAAEDLTSAVTVTTKLTGGATDDTIQTYFEPEIFN